MGGDVGTYGSACGGGGLRVASSQRSGGSQIAIRRHHKKGRNGAAPNLGDGTHDAHAGCLCPNAAARRRAVRRLGGARECRRAALDAIHAEGAAGQQLDRVTSDGGDPLDKEVARAKPATALLNES